MPDGYRFLPDPNAVAAAVLVQVHLGGAGADLPHRALHPGALQAEHRSPTAHLSELFKDIFLYHWREESQHAILDELEWVRENARLE